jgi:hypothetical protein
VSGDIWDHVALLGCALILTVLALALFVRWVDSRKPKQIDWVADHKRRISHRGYKSQIGAR